MRAIIFDLDGTLHDKTATLGRFALSQFERSKLDERYVDSDAWVRNFVALNNRLIPKPDVFSQLCRMFSLDQVLAAELLHDLDTRLGSFACPFPNAVELVRDCRSRGLGKR